MNRKISVLVVLISLIVAVSACAQAVRIDYRMNIRAEDAAANYFNWSIANRNTNDAFDTATGASKAGSTAGFDAVRFDSVEARQAAIPGGLRGLLLFPVADWGTAVADKLQVGASGKQVIIRYIHRGNAYEIRTDANGKLNLLTGCKVVTGADVNNPDWSKLVADTYSASASRHYEGSLDVAYTNGILTIKGNLTEKK
jgi:hypothetical protein